MKKWLVGALVLGLTGVPQGAFASGFKIAEQGAKGGGMGLAFVAQADDPTTVAMNPAGIHQLDGTMAAFTNAGIYAPGNEFDSDIPSSLQDQSADDQLFGVPSFFITTDLGFEKFNFGLGVYSMFGLSRDWDETGITDLNAEGIPAAGFGRIVNRVDLFTIFVNPVFSYELMGEKLAIAAGPIYGFGKLEVNSKPVVNLTAVPAAFGGEGIEKLADLNQEVEGDGWTFNIGLHSKLTEKLRLGAYYRHDMHMNLTNGSFRAANRNTTVFGAAAAAPARFKTSLGAELNLPGTAGFGFAYDVTPELLVEVNGEYNTWSVFDEVKADMGTPLTSSTGTVLVDDSTLTQFPRWDDSWAVRLGMQYKFSSALAGRVGYFYDETPVPEETLRPTLPDADRHGLTMGFGITDDWWNMDVAYMAVFMNDRDVNNTELGSQIPVQDGTYSSDPIHVFMLTSTVKF
ncbi:MAG: outer membrane protein transport protein [Planctomycetes bacterium]|nr:outer membrane protein transport protein [Planctomycetota bacterium]